MGATWRYEITLDGCDFPFLHFNEHLVEAGEPHLHPRDDRRRPRPGRGLRRPFLLPGQLAVCILPVHGGPLLQVYGHITRVDTATIEASTLDGDLIAVYEPTTEEPPYCSE